jgi:hypothetical protein
MCGIIYDRGCMSLAKRCGIFDNDTSFCHPSEFSYLVSSIGCVGMYSAVGIGNVSG